MSPFFAKLSHKSYNKKLGQMFALALVRKQQWALSYFAEQISNNKPKVMLKCTKNL